MRKLIAVIVISSLCLTSCNFLKNSGNKGGGKAGQIYTKQTSKGWTPIRPIGMVPIPSGSYIQGQADYDFAQQNNAPLKTVSVTGFFIDETEITNDQYKQFIRYTRDSLIRWNLAEKAAEMGYDASMKGQGGLSDYTFADPLASGDTQSPYYEFVQQNTTGREGDYSEARKLDWSEPLIWDVEEYPDQEYTEVLEGMYYAPDQRLNNSRDIDVRKLVFKYTWIDTEASARAKGKGKRSDFLKEENVEVYPDTTVWSRDFNYAYNEPMHLDYFSHESYIDYPVVGVTWMQANAFAAFRTQYHKNEVAAKRGKNKKSLMAYRIPNETEWEYAARGGRQNAAYPWGGPYLTDDRGCYLANFKPKRGDYLESTDEKNFGYLYTAPVKSYPPNNYGLYDMAGNVSEWTSSSYNNAAYQVSSSLNPSLGSHRAKIKTIRGGSWKDIGYLLMVGARDFENMDSARSFIGFRTVQTIPEGAKVRYRKVK